MWYNSGMDISNWINIGAAILVGGGTLTLAFMTWKSIRQTRNIQKSEKRERLLNEIIEWGIDVAKPKYALNLTSLTSSTISLEDQVSAYQLGQASYTQILIERGKYIGQIALIFTQDLSIAVENVRHDLEEHDKLIHDWIDSKCTSEAVGEHDYVIDQSASKVIEEAAKMKTGDIGKTEENMPKEGEDAMGKELTTKDIDDHLNQLGTQIKKGSYLTGAALGAAIALVGISFQVQMSFKLSPYVYIWFFIVVGLGFMFWCKWKQSKIK